MQVYSIGYAARALSISAHLVDKLAVELGIEPALTIDGVPHFHETDVNTMRTNLAAKGSDSK